MSGTQPTVSFGMIVLNGEPFLRYNLRALYPFAHQIIVAEGASPAAKAIASPDGHSTDRTLETIRQFQSEEDPEHKVILVTAEDEGHPNGFWPGEKDEQSRAYAKRATGNYLWQVDSDEFYQPRDMQNVLALLQDDPTITAVTFKIKYFWGGFDYITDGWYLMSEAESVHRLFKWGSDYIYTTHRPPTVVDRNGRDLRQINWLNAEATGGEGVYVYHYSTLFPKQVQEKVTYYANGPWGAYSDGVVRWAEENFLSTISHPLQIHNVHMYPSWLEIFKGTHPPLVEQMREDIESGTIEVDVRCDADINELLQMITYRAARRVTKLLFYFQTYNRFPKRRILNLIRRISYDHNRQRLFISKEYIR